MPTDPTKIAIKGSTQDHLQIEDIIDDVVILKDGSCAMVMQISSVNFDLLSEQEQSSLIFAYGGILNSLNFPIQIIIKSTTKDVESYLKRLKAIGDKQENALLKERIGYYIDFIEDTVKKNDVLSKSFYVVVRFSSLELGIKNARKLTVKGLMELGKNSVKALPYPKEYILEKAKSALEPRREHLMRLFARLGLEIKLLTTKELIGLFYKIYNEEVVGSQKLQTFNYGTPVVTVKK